MLQPGHQRLVVTEIARQLDDLEMRIGRRQRDRDGERAVGRSVIDQD
jgi:hypothetical protein